MGIINILWRIKYIPDWVKGLFRFIRRIPGYYKLDRYWDYEPDTYTFIIDNYSEVLCSRTHFMSKPTYYARDILTQLDDFYAEKDTGYWEMDDYMPKCSECGCKPWKGYIPTIKELDESDRWNYCPGCGALMEEKP